MDTQLKLILFNYIRKQGYDLKQMITEESDIILKEAEGSFPENPEWGQVSYFYSELHKTEFYFVYLDKWSLILSKA